MSKRILIFIATIGLLFFAGNFVHEFIIVAQQYSTRFTTFTMYGFHAIASMTIYLVIEFIYKFLPNETGYLFLASIMVKLGVFMLLFKDKIYAASLTGADKSILVIPLFVFLMIEVVFISLLLNNSEDFVKDVEIE